MADTQNYSGEFTYISFYQPMSKKIFVIHTKCTYKRVKCVMNQAIHEIKPSAKTFKIPKGIKKLQVLCVYGVEISGI